MITTQPCSSACYRGRFAPSPTGPLHNGALVAALASYLDAKHHGGSWRLRIDDIDPPRSIAGSAERIIDSLCHHGLQPDGEVDYQSQHSDLYDQALQALANRGLLFACRCTRATLHPAGYCQAGCSTEPFDERCLQTDGHQRGIRSPKPATSLRVKVDTDVTLSFDDAIKGYQQASLDAMLPNFIVRRRDGLYAYQLAAAIDDAMPGISHVIRGSDLLTSTFRQRYLQSVLGLDSPTYGHLPVLCHSDGSKLSKQTGAQAIDTDTPNANLRRALAFLGQPTPPKNVDCVEDILRFATVNWRRDALNPKNL